MVCDFLNCLLFVLFSNYEKKIDLDKLQACEKDFFIIFMI